MPAVQFLSVSEQTGTAAGGTAIDVKSLKTQGMYTAFSNYMQRNASSNQYAAQTAYPQQNASAQGAQGPAQAQSRGSQALQQYEKQQGQSAVQADKVTGAQEDAGAVDAAAGAVQEAVEEITEAIKENLGVDDDQMQEAMEILGLTQVDLLNPQNLIALAVELTGSEDAGAMLFHENFQNLMQEAAVITDDLLKDLGLTMDELMDKLQNAADVPMQNPQDTPMMPEGMDVAQPQEAAVTQPEVTQPETDIQQPDIETTPQAAQTLETTQTTQEEATVDATAQEVTASTQAQEAQPVRENMQPETEERVQPQAEQQAQPDAGTAVTEQAQEQPQGQSEQATQQDSEQSQAQPDAETSRKKEARETDAQDADSRSVRDVPRFDFNAQIQQPGAAAPIQQPVTAQAAPMPQVNMQDVIQQIVEYSRVNITEEVKSIEMQLNPENLGKIYINVSEKQGTITAQLTAQNENMKEALVQQAAILKDTLNQQGIKVDAVEVSTGAHEFENNLERDAHSQEEQARQQEEQAQKNARRSINLNDYDDLDGLSGLMSEEEALVAQIMRDNGNNVDFRA